MIKNWIAKILRIHPCSRLNFYHLTPNPRFNNNFVTLRLVCIVIIVT